jgi:hypothetical protein
MLVRPCRLSCSLMFYKVFCHLFGCAPMVQSALSPLLQIEKSLWNTICSATLPGSLVLLRSPLCLTVWKCNALPAMPFPMLNNLTHLPQHTPENHQHKTPKVKTFTPSNCWLKLPWASNHVIYTATYTPRLKWRAMVVCRKQNSSPNEWNLFILHQFWLQIDVQFSFSFPLHFLLKCFIAINFGRFT